MYKLLSCLSRKGVNALSGCYLISTANLAEEIGDVENVVSMPSRAVTSFLPGISSGHAKTRLPKVSMPSRAVTSFLQYPFKNLGFMRFPETVFAGICQNILTATHFHAC